MAIGTPASLGTNTVSGSTSSLAITTITGILSGDFVVVAISYNSATAIVSSVSDGSNTYAKAYGTKTGSGGLEVWYAANCSAVASSSSITITLSAAAAQMSIGAGRVPGVSATPFDVGATSVTQTTSPSVSTGTLAQTGEIVFGAIGGFNITGITEDASFTRVFTPVGFGSQVPVGLAYKIVTAQTTVAYAPTLTGGLGNMVAGAGGFKAAVVGVNITGVAGTSAAGTAVANVGAKPTGASATGQAGTLSIQYFFQGVQATGQVGAITPQDSAIISGVFATGAAGTLMGIDGFMITGVSGQGIANVVYPIPPAPTRRPPLLIPEENRLPASLWLGSND